MPFVLDASVVVAWLSAETLHPIAEAALERLATDHGVVPAFWWFDVRQALLTGERRGHRDIAGTAAFLQRLGRLPVVVDRELDEAALFYLARGHELAIRDATYLELALRLGGLLATMNRDLSRTAAQAGVALLVAP